MRPRSISVYASPFQVAHSGKNLPTLANSLIKSELPIVPLRKSYSTEGYSNMFEDFGPMVLETKEQMFTGDLGKLDAGLDKTAPSSQAQSPLCDPIESMPLCIDEILSDNEPEKIQNILRSMVIVPKGFGTHSFLKNIFSIEQIQDGMTESQPFDVITHTITEETYEERYLFWIKEINFRGKRVEPLLEAYYKSCSVFFIIYDATNENSIDQLKEELERINKAKPLKQQGIILINSNGIDRNQIQNRSSPIIDDLKEKFNISFHLESADLEKVSIAVAQYAKSFMKQI